MKHRDTVTFPTYPTEIINKGDPLYFQFENGVLSLKKVMTIGQANCTAAEDLFGRFCYLDQDTGMVFNSPETSTPTNFEAVGGERAENDAGLSAPPARLLITGLLAHAEMHNTYGFDGDAEQKQWAAELRQAAAMLAADAQEIARLQAELDALKQHTTNKGTENEQVRPEVAAVDGCESEQDNHDGFAGDSHLVDFKDDQWWMTELEALVKDGTGDQIRAVAVVRHLLRLIHTAHQLAKPLEQGQGWSLLGYLLPYGREIFDTQIAGSFPIYKID
jgi:hypothetical protein